MSASERAASPERDSPVSPLVSLVSSAAQAGVHVPLGFGAPLVEATFVARPNRFLVEAMLDGELVQAHLADRGRLKETLISGTRLLLADHVGKVRKTRYQAVAAYRAIERSAEHERITSLDTQLPNRLIEAALRAGVLPQFADYPVIRREVQVGGSRFDFQLSDGQYRCTLEVKSAGFVENGIALFPDAPTERGRRHLHELAELARAGERAAVVFVAQGDAHTVAMNTAIDPEFARALRHAAEAEVEVYAYACPLASAGITLGGEVPVVWS